MPLACPIKKLKLRIYRQKLKVMMLHLVPFHYKTRCRILLVYFAWIGLVCTELIIISFKNFLLLLAVNPTNLMFSIDIFNFDNKRQRSNQKLCLRTAPGRS